MDTDVSNSVKHADFSSTCVKILLHEKHFPALIKAAHFWQYFTHLAIKIKHARSHTKHIEHAHKQALNR